MVCKLSLSSNGNIDNDYAGQIIAGVDEAGRGPLAGPVVAAAVIIDPNVFIEGINDSKKISAKKREELYTQIIEKYECGVGIVSPQIIDKINILQATIKACELAEEELSMRADVVLVDGNMKFSSKRFNSIIKGDSKSYSIAAASIIAKVTRDRIMDDLHASYTEYNWKKNKGYGTKEHLLAIEEHGICDHHRKTFKTKGV